MNNEEQIGHTIVGSRDQSRIKMAPDGSVIRNRTEGHVIECDGMHAVISAIKRKEDTASEDYWSVGMLISISVGDGVRTIGMLYKVESDDDGWSLDGDNRMKIHVELVGEITNNAAGKPFFNGGISAYPHLGAVAHRIRSADLSAVFENSDTSAVKIGTLSQNSDIPALIAIDAMLSRHFAVVGTTGVGKSSTVTLLMRKIIEQRPDMRILILDPHNEFSSAFPDKSIVITESNLDLPFWAFKLEEFVEVLFRGNEHIPAEVDILRDLIPRAKQLFKGDDKTSLRRSQRDIGGITADTPVPYRISDLVRMIDDSLGKLGIAEQRSTLKSLLARINALTNDPNFRFMFSNKAIEDNLDGVLSTIFRVPANGKPITVFQLNGIPSEVVNAVVSVLCRLAFDLAVWSDSKIKTLVLCEEAHRYIPANKADGFAPTRQAIARIAKEGRKYGVSLGVVTQRPGELDETILSQCNTFVAMRLGNDVDQDIVRKAIAGASQSYLNFLPSLANREAIMFGQGVNTPMRMRFINIPKHELPANHLMEEVGSKDDNVDIPIDISTVLLKIRFPGGQLDSDSMMDAAPLGASLVDEQPASIMPQKPSSDRFDTVRQNLFAETTPLRSASAQPNDAIRQRQSASPTPEIRTGNANSIISRFRKS
ncbi:DUF87 domain-containing protein [Ahrensia kielensis]|uniref:DUF87 domain-containing protein n=1 Tax=Ahrensia kielensis TaxID=76980 RepID=A0ABU9T4J5_9HYPH